MGRSATTSFVRWYSCGKIIFFGVAALEGLHVRRIRLAQPHRRKFIQSIFLSGLSRNCLALPLPCPPPFVCRIIYNSTPVFFPPSILRQSAARQARHDILHGTPIAGAGCDMGNVAGVFEAIARACPQQGSPLWPDSVFDQQARVARTRRDFGLDWRYANNCTIGNHSAREVTPDQSARLRAATVITIPNGVSATFQDNVFDFFRSSAPTDLAISGQSLCPYCADNVHQNMCDWTLLPWTSNTAPDRIFFRSSCVFRGLDGRPMAPSMTFTMRAAYSLVGVSYFLPLGGGTNRNHFVSQVRIRGRWHKYDCLQGDIVTSSDAYDKWMARFFCSHAGVCKICHLRSHASTLRAIFCCD